MEVKGLISVIVPVYNGAAHIGQTIENITASTYQNLELILVNDGSKDDSASVIESYAKSDPRVRLITQENGGIVAARNTGLQYVLGEYIHFCDQDDIVVEDMYQKMISRMVEDDSDMGICSVLKFNEKDELMLEQYEDNLLVGEAVRMELLYPVIQNGFRVEKTTNYTTGPHIWNVVMKASIVKEHNIQFKRFVNYEDDLIMNVDLLAKANRVSLIKDYGYKWRVNMKSESHRIDKYIDHYYEKKTNLMNYVMNTIGYEDKEAIDRYIIAHGSYDLLKILKNEMAKDNPKSFSGKMKYLRDLSGDYTRKNLLATAGACYFIHWKIILYICAIFGIRIGYICDYLLLNLIRLLDITNVSLLVEKIVTK